MGSKSGRLLLDKGDVLNEKWEIIEHLATGGMAEVYRARQLRLDREVAIKVLSREFLASFGGDEEEMRVAVERFDREVKAMAQVRHQNVLQIFDHEQARLGERGEGPSIDYIAMEYIPGPNLRSTLLPEGMQGDEKGIRNWIRTCLLPILDGVETVHNLGIIHRDLKPENVLLDGHTPKIADFGLAGGARWRSVTRSHHIAGTAPYQAPEQFIDMGETDVRADIYSLGKMLYESVEGSIDRKAALFFKTARLSKPDTPFLKRLDRIIQQATNEDKNQRTPSVTLLRENLLELLEDGGKARGRFGPSFFRGFGLRKTLVVFIAVMVIAAASVGLHRLYRRDRLPSAVPPVADVLPKTSQVAPSDSADNTAVTLSSHPSSLVGKDGATLHLVRAGEWSPPDGYGFQPGTRLHVDAYYMDETEVTNHQFVEFLNRVLPRIRVDEGVVKGDGDVWLHLGEVRKGYEPIVFRDGRFLVQNPAYHSHAVVRVSGYAAAAYVLFYGRRLPTDVEWLYAVSEKGESPARPAGVSADSTGTMSTMEAMHSQMQSASPGQRDSSESPRPVAEFDPNLYGIRGLRENVREWTLRPQMDPSGERGGRDYLILPQNVVRHPGEAFDEVGFRTALRLIEPAMK